MSELITIPELAKWLKVQPSTVRSWLLHRSIPYLKAGGRVRFEKTAIEKWLQQRAVPAEVSRG